MTSSCLHLHRLILFDCFENLAIRRKECHFCFASMSANGQTLIYNPTKYVIVQDWERKSKGRARATRHAFLFDRIVVTDNCSLEKLLIKDYNNEKEKKQQQKSPSYDALLLLLKFRRGQGSNLGKPVFFQAFFSQLHKLPAYLTVMTFSAFIFCIINSSLLRPQG